MAEDNLTQIQERDTDLYPETTYRELVDAGVFYGRKKSKTNPKMKSKILLNRNGIEIINLDKTIDVLNKALTFLKEKINSGALVLMVATQPPALGAVKLAREFNWPIVTKRWLGGTLTNFKIISKRIDYYKKLKSDLASGALGKYTKKERLMMEKETIRLDELFADIQNMAVRPDLLIVIDPNIHTTAVREARRLKIPIIAYANTDSDPDLLDFAIIGNNKARTSINWFLSKIREAVKDAKNMPPLTSGEEAKEKTEAQGESIT
jgi:small subunit ribosomal protein S2